MCDCARSLEELATIINREDPMIDRVYDQDGPYWARGLKKHVIVSLLASNIPTDVLACDCPSAKRLRRISQLAADLAMINAEGSMLERAAVDNAYTLTSALVSGSEEANRLIAFMDAATEMTTDKKGNSATGLKAAT